MKKVQNFGPEELQGRVFERVNRQLTRYEKESRFLVKDTDLMQTKEEVFDETTLMTLNGLIRRGVFSHLNGVVKAGKESRIYWGKKDNQSDVAIKIHLVTTSEFKRRLNYIIGDPRFKRIKSGTRNVVSLWAKKEFKNLKAAYEARIPVPKPHTVKRNIVVMDFVGAEGVPFPLLSESKVSRRDYKRIVELIKILFNRAKLVHADLSEHNIFKKNDVLIPLDFGSAVNVLHPMSKEFLKRDLLNVNRFFSKREVDVIEIDELIDLVIER